MDGRVRLCLVGPRSNPRSSLVLPFDGVVWLHLVQHETYCGLVVIRASFSCVIFLVLVPLKKFIYYKTLQRNRNFPRFWSFNNCAKIINGLTAFNIIKYQRLVTFLLVVSYSWSRLLAVPLQSFAVLCSICI